MRSSPLDGQSCKIHVISILLVILFTALPSAAAEREIIADGEYIMGDGETMSVAEQRARMNAVQKAAEQAGAYVRSYTKTRDMVVEEDLIEIIADHVMKITVVSKKREMAGNAVRFTVRIKAVFSEADIEKNLTRLAEDRGSAAAYRDLQKAFNRQAEELETLKQQLSAVSEGDRKAVLAKIGQNEQQFKATLAVEEGIRKLAALDFSGAEERFSQAIELDPSQAKAYAGRAEARLFYGETSSLLSDADRAVSLEPDNANFYAVRARVRAFRHCTREKRDGCEAVFSDLSRASRLDPKNPAYPSMLGKMYSVIGQYDRAVQAYERAVKILPSLAMPMVAVNTYLYRADFFLNEAQPGYLQKALADLDRAVEIITGPVYLKDETRKFARLIRQRPRTREDTIRVMKEIFGVADFTKISAEEREAWGKRYEQAVKVLSEVSQVCWKRSKVRYEAGDVAGAEKDRQTACEACEEPEQGIRSRMGAGMYTVIDGDFCKPERAFKPFPSQDALTAFQSFKRGQRAVASGRLELAVGELSRAIRFNSGDTEAYLFRGLAYMYADSPKTDLAIADFTSALGIDPRNDRILYERALAWFVRGKDQSWQHDEEGARKSFSAAAGDCTLILSRVTGDSYIDQARELRAKVYTSMDRWSDAAADWTAAGNVDQVLVIAGVLARTGHRAEALKAVDDFIAAARKSLGKAGEEGDSGLEEKIARAEAERSVLAKGP